MKKMTGASASASITTNISFSALTRTEMMAAEMIIEATKMNQK